VLTKSKEVIKMANNRRNYDEELARIMDGLAESILDASEEELDEELHQDGEIPERVAAEVRAILHKSVKIYRQRTLWASQQVYQDKLINFNTRKHKLPESFDEQRNLLMHVLNNNPSARSYLTAQNRDFTELPDSEVASYLRQLCDLGALDSLNIDEEK
jgi:hypothetical protein